MAADIAVKVSLKRGGIGENLSRTFSVLMAPVLTHLISACMFLLLSGGESIDGAPLGFMEGHLKIISPREVELADGKAPVITAENYAEYPLIILSQDGKKEIARITADENGNYRLALPPGNYILDVQGRPPKGHVRAKPQPFTIAPDQIARIDMDIDTGVR
jgi:hypothetical protein